MEYIEPILGFIASAFSLDVARYSNPTIFLGGFLVPFILFYWALLLPLRKVPHFGRHPFVIKIIAFVIAISGAYMVTFNPFIFSLVLSSVIAYEHRRRKKWIMFIVPASVIVFYFFLLPIVASFL